MNESAALLMNLSDVASLAQVQRPVVSMWRKRSAGSALPFPDPVALEGGREVFDADQVAAWLAATGRGNNPEALNDVAAFAKMPLSFGAHGSTLDALTALLTLKAMTGTALGQLTPDELLDVADECDPDDMFLYSELEAMGPSLASTAAFADRLVDSAYNAPAAFEQLLEARFRAGLREHSETALTDPALALVANAAVELAATLDGNTVFADTTRGSSDLLIGVVQASGEDAPVTFLTADDDGGAGRLARRRLRVHGVDREQIRVDASGEFAVDGAVVHVAQYPSPGQPGMDDSQILSAVEHLALQMDDQQRAVIIAPARVLCDVPLSAAAAGVRSGILRTGRVRAIVRLPQGLLRSKPREAQALWVLGPSFAEVPIAERWTMVADLSTRDLTEDVGQDLISDIVASMGDRSTIRAHSFRFARLVQTRLLLANKKSLVGAPTRSSTPSPSSAEAALRAEELARLLWSSRPELSDHLTVLPGNPNATAQPASVQELITGGNLKYIKGSRLEDADLRASGGTRVLRPDDLLNPHTATPRYLNLLDFAANYPSARLTEPGDVVFCTSPRPAAIVDTQGGSAVVFPARVLRIDPADPGGLLAHVVAADINRLPAADKSWRQWRLRRVPDAQRKRLSDSLAELQHEQQQARERLKRLEELATLITDGVAGGSLTLTDPSTKLAGPQTEGTR
ncbi:helix-turn-helix transcriptional regulator [Arthrobacter sp. MMS24-S77]